MYFPYWHNVFSDLSGDLMLAHTAVSVTIPSQMQQCEHPRACVSSQSPVPPWVLVLFCCSQFSLARGQSKAPDHFSSVHWPKEHHKQRGARCMRQPCDSIIRDRQLQPGRVSCEHSRQPATLSVGTEAQSFTLPQASQVSGLSNASKALHIISFQRQNKGWIYFLLKATVLLVSLPFSLPKFCSLFALVQSALSMNQSWVNATSITTSFTMSKYRLASMWLEQFPVDFL